MDFLAFAMLMWLPGPLRQAPASASNYVRKCKPAEVAAMLRLRLRLALKLFAYFRGAWRGDPAVGAGPITRAPKHTHRNDIH